MSLGGKTTNKVKIPEWVEDAARSALGRAEDVSRVGYTPYYGPDVAAFTPQQTAAFQNVNNQAAAFGMGGGAVNMPQAQDYGGFQAYSSAPMFEGAVHALADNRPGQYGAIMGQFIDPVTGAAPAGQDAPQDAPQDPPPSPAGYADPRPRNSFLSLLQGGQADYGNSWDSPMGGGLLSYDNFYDRMVNSDGGLSVRGGDSYRGLL